MKPRSETWLLWVLAVLMVGLVFICALNLADRLCKKQAEVFSIGGIGDNTKQGDNYGK